MLKNPLAPYCMSSTEVTLNFLQKDARKDAVFNKIMELLAKDNGVIAECQSAPGKTTSSAVLSVEYAKNRFYAFKLCDRFLQLCKVTGSKYG